MTKYVLPFKNASSEANGSIFQTPNDIENIQARKMKFLVATCKLNLLLIQMFFSCIDRFD